jgi:hypothetical protein
MLLKNIFGILILLLNAGGVVYLGYLGVKKAFDAVNATSQTAVVKKKEAKQEEGSKEDVFNEKDFQKDDDLIDDFDLTDFDDLDFDDLD